VKKTLPTFVSDRRRIIVGLLGGAAVAISPGLLARMAAEKSSPALPKQVAGVTLPDTALARAAADLARQASPGFLFNHCMRTFVFGALLAERDHVAYDPEMIFIAAALHDLGLTQSYATPEHSFEMDGADAAMAFLASHGVSDARAELVWNAIALHTSALVEHFAPQTSLIGSGAGADVFGAQTDALGPERVRAVLAAFPRLSFNNEFRDLLVEHCHRKPFSQRGTWLDVFCRTHNPGVKYPDLEERLLATHPPQ
jgi:hypothetical protein